MPYTLTNTERQRQSDMFSTMELRLIRASVKKTMESLKKRLEMLDPESDDAVEASNDLVLYQSIVDKISEKSDV